MADQPCLSLEDLLRGEGISWIHERMLDYLDPPARRACLATSHALRGFVIRSTRERHLLQERAFNWRSTCRPLLHRAGPCSEYEDEIACAISERKGNDLLLFAGTKCGQVVRFRNLELEARVGMFPSAPRDFASLMWTKADALMIVTRRVFDPQRTTLHVLSKKFENHSPVENTDLTGKTRAFEALIKSGAVGERVC